MELFFSAGDDEYEWKQLRVGGVTPGEVDDDDDDDVILVVCCGILPMQR
mgnify:FL=1